MKYILSLYLVIICSGMAAAREALSESFLKQKVEAFLQAKNARQQPGTTEKDIDYFISFLADEFVDEHVKFGVTVKDKSELRKGMVFKMKDEVFFSNIIIEKMMFGRDVVFVKYKEHAKVKPSHLDKVVEYTSTNIMSLEFNSEGLITHIRRHHG